MSDTATPGPSVRPRFPGWIKLLLAVSVVLMLSGLVLPLVMPSQPTTPRSGISSFSNEGRSADEPAPAEWSQAVFRLGFSFFVAFVAAYALRTVFKLALLFAGFIALLLFGLQYAGMVDIKWAAMEREYGQVSGWLSSQFSSVKAFATGYLPSGSAAAFGFVSGFRKAG